MCCDALREEWASLPAPEMVAWSLIRATQDVLALLDAEALVFFLAATAYLRSLKRAGENSTDEIALRKASSSFKITPAGRGTLFRYLRLQSTDGIEAASLSFLTLLSIRRST